ncbi:MAG: hypothetical protein L6V93_09370 [Clostridiales bacterium]|nr:MAG: hypothetical protein L6V93_09370 [Clostridiales bacterium]
MEKNYDVTLLLFCKTGGLSDKIPESIKSYRGKRVFEKFSECHTPRRNNADFLLFFCARFFAVLTRIFQNKIHI